MMLRRMKLVRLLAVSLLVSLAFLFLLYLGQPTASPANLHEQHEAKELFIETSQKRRDDLPDKRQLEPLRGNHQELVGAKPQFKRPRDLNYSLRGAAGGAGRGINEYHRMKQTEGLRPNKGTSVNENRFTTEEKIATSTKQETGRIERINQFTEKMKMEMYRIHKKYVMERSNASKLLLGEAFSPEAYLSPQRYHGGPKEVMSRFQFNQLASDNTPYNRSLWDVRTHQCMRRYDGSSASELPTTSVIICFHNEARSALLRTIYSVLSHEPAKLIKEIILVDDFSDDINDGEILSVIPKVKLIRLNERQGLIRARLTGARAAQGEVLTFLDSHCEVTPGWLEPLLARIKEDRRHVVSPIIDIIRKDDMKYNQANANIKGGFGHNLLFKWDNLNWQELQRRRQDNTAPIPTPAIAGGLFSIDRGYFKEIGSYDEEMEIWGGENVEFSIRVWMCGGRLEIMPCSHVGHIFRSSMPYSFGKGKSYHTTVTRNLRRIAEVWMDEYKYLFYNANAAARSIPFGNVSSRVEIRKRLQCKPFSWFVEKVYPDFVPSSRNERMQTTIRIKQGVTDCLQCQDYTAGLYKLMVKECDVSNNRNMWTFTPKGHIKHETLCLTAANSVLPPAHQFRSTIGLLPPPGISLSFCHVHTDPSQVFETERVSNRRIRGDPKRDSFVKIKHKATGYCLAKHEETQLAVLQSCDTNSDSLQIWSLTL
ncbi:PREDICTED: polypeptide N-acetylgalactosaminyltransferase 2-like [Amphimedon queenslandica]|uniref:Polypeptide N-acetylgalactosaminyltransferase n=1 Tax=Amphimedon queenslandica TaxID=400682 RepID=A0A1X7VH55_AMPQE|nr:PREDICTED: polypeptide N-acetylgalactosaminyltransferase 2-like [Amphimedon queenslandica]|eukprot:XP_019849116.1 PREDICTED: polypeptide N-acetylgalactosaminyltransferase 2-like [Amphimedon queenslandica]